MWRYEDTLCIIENSDLLVNNCEVFFYSVEYLNIRGVDYIRRSPETNLIKCAIHHFWDKFLVDYFNCKKTYSIYFPAHFKPYYMPLCIYPLNIYSNGLIKLYYTNPLLFSYFMFALYYIWIFYDNIKIIDSSKYYFWFYFLFFINFIILLWFLKKLVALVFIFSFYLNLWDITNSPFWYRHYSLLIICIICFIPLD